MKEMPMKVRNIDAPGSIDEVMPLQYIRGCMVS
jgi:hypothetical protein